jgi:integrase
MRDERADTPGAANTIVRMLKLVLNFAVEEEWIEANPAARMKLLKVGEWRAWTDEECAAFEGPWAPGTMERRAYTLALYTGQRKSDLVLMARAHRKGGTIRVVQGKTGEELWVPEHRELNAELSRGVIGHMSLLTTSQGKGFDPVYFGAWFADAIEAAGLPEDCVLHGLRKTAARRLADAGCSEDEIKAVTGHTTSRMVAHYTKVADKRKRASAAIHKLENSK